MATIKDYRQCFVEVFELDSEDEACGLEYQGIENWDSVGHMSLMSELEDKLDIVLDMEDIIDFASYKKGIEILAKYGISLGDVE